MAGSWPPAELLARSKREKLRFRFPCSNVWFIRRFYGLDMQVEAAAGESTILIVEDEPSIAEAMKYSLEREGFRVETAFDGRQALARFRSNPPALVLLDLMLPEIPGLDVCKILRSESIVPILMVTAKDAESDKIVLPRGRSRRLHHQAVFDARAGVEDPGASPPGIDGGSSPRTGGPHRWRRGDGHGGTPGLDPGRLPRPSA